MEKEALEFMIRNKLDQCYECGGRVFKNKHMAEEMDAYTGKQHGITTYEREALAKKLSASAPSEEK